MAFQGSNPCDVNETVESKYCPLDYAYFQKLPSTGLGIS
jgi:hypothetical protein